MINECLKICGAGFDEIMERLKPYENSGVCFEIRESNLDAEIIMSSELDYSEFERVSCAVYNLFEKEVYSAENTELQELAAKLLHLNRNKLSVAESLTGGEICSRLTEVAGISEVFYEGVVCYDRNSKVERLGVSRDTLADYGAVSKQTAYEMVRGLLAGGKADIALATTGLAGPTGDEGKPVGLVYIAVGSKDYITVFERRFSGNRNQVRHSAANVALFYLVRFLQGNILQL